MDHRFVRSFVLVTALLAAAVYLSRQAIAHGGVLLTVAASATGLLGIVGFAALARLIGTVERKQAP
jgi:hypothetical protein